MKTLIAIFAVLALSLPFASAIKVFSNPIIPEENLPDPGAIFYEGYYYVANTASPSDPGKFAIHRSVDLQNWDYVSDVFPSTNIPSWSGPNSDFWAPELHIINGQFRVIYTSREVSSGLLCVGIGSADNITGPYTDSGAPIIKNTTVGSIDASVMSLNNGTYYLIWKDDGNGNNPQIPTWIKAQLLNSDGLSVSGPVYYLLDNTLSWEGAITEGPWVIQRGDYYYLFYSGAGYCDASYSVGVARSQNPLGPYEKKGDQILKSDATWIGPGHCSVLPVNGMNDTWVMIYHSWYQGQVCGSYHRLLMIDYVYWSDDEWPYMINSGPTYADPNGYTYWKWFVN